MGKAKPKTGQSQFDGLFEAVSDTPVETDVAGELSSPAKPQTRSAKRNGKSSDPDYKKVTVYLSKALHQRMKQYAFDEETEQSLLIEQAVDLYLKGEGY